MADRFIIIIQLLVASSLIAKGTFTDSEPYFAAGVLLIWMTISTNIILNKLRGAINNDQEI